MTGVLETEAGDVPGPEAPRYIVKSIDFPSSPASVVEPEAQLVDVDQCFPAASPPQKMLGTAIDFLAPEVAVGLNAGPASDVWALGCCIFRLGAGDGPFSNPREVTTPTDLMSHLIHTLGSDTMPHAWDSTLWDSNGMPTKDASKGTPLLPWSDGARSLRDLVYNIWDEPDGRAIQRAGRKPLVESEHLPFHPSWSDMAWNPRAIKVDDGYLAGYDDDWDMVLEALPKIPDDEAALLYDLLSRIFVYDPEKRAAASELLEYPWFYLELQP